MIKTVGEHSSNVAIESANQNAISDIRLYFAHCLQYVLSVTPSAHFPLLELHEDNPTSKRIDKRKLRLHIHNVSYYRIQAHAHGITILRIVKLILNKLYQFHI